MTPEGRRETCEDENNAEDRKCRVNDGVLITSQIRMECLESNTNQGVWVRSGRRKGSGRN